MRRLAALGVTVAGLMAPPPAAADGPATPQAVAANADFLATLPAPPGGAGAVCVIDSGVDADTDLGPALGERGSVLGAPFDDLGATSDTGVALAKHGTYVAGVIASQIDGVGSSGIWPAARVVSNRVFAGGKTTAADYIQAITWCQTRTAVDVKVINLSIAGLAMTTAERNQLANKIAQTRDVFDINVVAAAGNRGRAELAFPAAFPEVLAVGATDLSGRLAAFSNRGPALDLAAPGVGVCVTTATGTRLGVGSGTSYAAPVVAAVLLALRSHRPSLTAPAAEATLRSSARAVDGVPTLDARAAFGQAGLGGLAAGSPPDVEPCETVVPGGGASTPAPDAEPEVSAQPALATELPGAPAPPPAVAVAAPIPAGPTRLSRPVLRTLRLRAGVLHLRVRVREPVDRLTFSVDGRRFVRTAPVLRVRRRTWRRIVVRAHRGPLVSAPLRVVRHREF